MSVFGVDIKYNFSMRRQRSYKIRDSHLNASSVLLATVSKLGLGAHWKLLPKR